MMMVKKYKLLVPRSLSSSNDCSNCAVCCTGKLLKQQILRALITRRVCFFSFYCEYVSYVNYFSLKLGGEAEIDRPRIKKNSSNLLLKSKLDFFLK